MFESFEKVVGRINPCQIKIKGGKVPHMGDWGSFPPTSFPPVP
jgi:hypothetical protein